MKSVFNMNHFTMQQSRGGDVGTHGSCVRSSGISGVGAGLLEWTHEPYVPTLFTLITNDLHLALQSRPFHRAIWAILGGEISHIVR